MSKEVTANNYETSPNSFGNDWLANMPEDIRKAESLSKFKDVSSLAQSYLEAEKSLNQRVLVPLDFEILKKSIDRILRRKQMEQITDSLKEQFAKNITLVIQQEGSKLRKCVTNGTQDTEVISFELMTTHEVESRTRHPIDPDDHLHEHYAEDGYPAGLEQIEFKIPTISRRFLTASSYHWNATMDRNDKLNLLTDPTSHFPKMAGWAMGRQQDRVIISAFASPVRAGRTGNNVINFDVANNVVPVGFKVTNPNLNLNTQTLVCNLSSVCQEYESL